MLRRGASSSPQTAASGDVPRVLVVLRSVGSRSLSLIMVLNHSCHSKSVLLWNCSDQAIVSHLEEADVLGGDALVIMQFYPASCRMTSSRSPGCLRKDLTGVETIVSEKASCGNGGASGMFSMCDSSEHFMVVLLSMLGNLTGRNMSNFSKARILEGNFFI